MVKNSSSLIALLISANLYKIAFGFVHEFLYTRNVARPRPLLKKLLIFKIKKQYMTQTHFLRKVCLGFGFRSGKKATIIFGNLPFICKACSSAHLYVRRFIGNGSIAELHIFVRLEAIPQACGQIGQLYDD